MSHIIRYFKALSDYTRLRLMHVLMRYELSVNELVHLMEAGQSRVSRHLKVLADAGLLNSRRDGLWVFYSAVTEGEARQFLDSVTPFFTADMNMRADMSVAANLIAERTRGTQKFFNEVADQWDTLNREILGDFNLAQAVALSMPKGCKIAVDLGCGTGLVLSEMRQFSEQLIGVDGSPRMLELSRRRFAEDTSVSLRIGELEHLPIGDKEADFACMNLVLHHLSDPVIALAEIHRVLKSGATLFLSDFDHHNEERMRSDYGDRWLGFDRKALEKMLSDVGFTQLSFTSQPLDGRLFLIMVRAICS